MGTVPLLRGVHHLLVPVADLAEGEAWWARAFLARRIPEYDHVDENGRLYAVIMRLPGVEPMLQLRLDDASAEQTAGYGPFAFAVEGRAELDRWLERLDALGVPHSPVRAGMIGDVCDVVTTSGLVVRLYTR
jgi:catechol 2,3-dioxygenase-like lactoylglutathione lyase family enzyme